MPQLTHEEKIIEKLDMIIALLAIQGKTKNDQIKTLHSLSFAPKIISQLTGIPGGTVRRIVSTKLKRK